MTSLRGLEGQVNAHSQLGAQLVRSSDARRRLVNELDIEFQSLDSRVKSSLDRVWAVFGKVVGRDYLVEASRTLDELGRHLDDLGDLHGYGPSTVAPIIVREKAFGALLTENQSSITRVLGADWLAQTRANLDRVAWLRDLLVRTDSPAQGDERGLRAEPRRSRDGRPQGQLAIRGVARVRVGAAPVGRDAERASRSRSTGSAACSAG